MSYEEDHYNRLATAIQQGGAVGEKAERELYTSGVLQGIVRKIVVQRSNGRGTEEDANMVMNDSFRALWRSLKNNEFDHRSALTTYFHAIVVHVWLAKLSQKQPDLLPLPAVPENFVIEIESTHSSMLEHIRAKMPKECYEIFTLIGDRYKYSEIADKLGYKNADVVKTKRYNCTQKLHHWFEETHNGWWIRFKKKWL